ncbi:PSD1 and planctomycete cytochrome C domain-containing protein [Verrucomicrobia bacterium]|nr:PSD1 and planctomycete cytochrome C domain-containing protein [Verrucomicrobiota bacterium]
MNYTYKSSFHNLRSGYRHWIFLLSLPFASSLAGEISFNRDIRPILSANCFSCHGPDKKARKAKLRLDTQEGALFDLGGYRALEPGKADDSELILRVESNDPDEVMPPPDSGHELTENDRKVLRQWVNAGGKYETHWSFKRPVKAPLPKTNRTDWPLLPLDHFILSKLESNGMKPSRDLDRHRWIRRVSLDLTGLPPTPEDADSFAADKGEDAYEKVVDRLLSSNTYGEHWARMWLDLARFADTKGYEKDRHRDVWRYRDWVIDAFNKDMPFDQFTTEQLAGDLLPEPTAGQMLATAFHRNTMENDEGGTDNEEFRVAAVKDRVDTTVQVWMGLTMGCAKCHSHKYDPISIEDYYSFYAIFNQTEDADQVTPVMPFPTADQSIGMKELEDEIDSLKERIKSKPDGFSEALAKWKKQLEKNPLWTPLRLLKMESKGKVTLSQSKNGTLSVNKENPEKDTWILTLRVPEGKPLRAIRIDALPKKKGGEWKDKNVALRELTVEWIEVGKPPVPLTLKNPRADFSQRGWEVAKAIDGKTNAGWAFSPKASERHVAIFDFANPVSGGRLKVTLEQEYGQGLLFEKFRISASTHLTKWLTPQVDLTRGLNQLFEKVEFPQTRKLHTQLESLNQRLGKLKNGLTKIPIMRERPPSRHRENRIHNRGNFLDQGDKVQPHVPKVFGQLPKDAKANRLGVSHWLMQPENPLTARVMVNRVWARLFGKGLVETEEDFGSQGLMPSHPQLLDWLAIDYRENGWSLKKMLRTIVLSRTYRQSSFLSPQSLASDPVNRFLGRGPRFRLSAEVLRDQSLFASGLLTREIGGPSVMPPQPPGVWKSTYSGEKWKNATGPDRYRRALYTYLKRTSPHPAMITFDAGSGEVCQIRRIRTNTPLQALITLNDEAYVEASGALATLMLKSSDVLAQQITFGFRKTLIRKPDSEELKRLIELYRQLEPEFSKKEDFLASAKLKTGDPAMVALASVLLNLDETLMKP